METAQVHDPVVGTLQLRQFEDRSPKYLEDLNTQGYAVAKAVLSPEKADMYTSRAYDWLESFGTGIRRDDLQTWQVSKLPPHSK